MLAGVPGISTAGSFLGPSPAWWVRSSPVWWSAGRLEQGGEPARPGPGRGQVQVQTPGGGDHSGGDVDQAAANRRGRGPGVGGSGQGGGGAGEVERDGGQHGPGGVGGEHPRGQVRQGPVLQVGDDLFDDRVITVV